MKDCRRIAEAIEAAGGEPSPETAAAVEEHLVECEACRARLEAMRKAADAVAGAPEVDEARWEEIWRRVEERAGHRELKSAFWRSVWRGGIVTALAAGLLVAAYVFVPETARNAGSTAAAAPNDFEVVSLEVESPHYDIMLMTADKGEIPVIWLERM